MKYLLVIILASTLISCGDNAEKIVPTRDDKTFKMTVEVVSAAKMVEFCSALGVEYKANGCNKFNLDTKECIIYVTEPTNVGDTEKFAVIGHELWHCRYGKWHST